MALGKDLLSKSFLVFISHCFLILPPTCVNPTDSSAMLSEPLGPKVSNHQRITRTGPPFSNHLCCIKEGFAANSSS